MAEQHVRVRDLGDQRGRNGQEYRVARHQPAAVHGDLPEQQQRLLQQRHLGLPEPRPSRAAAINPSLGVGATATPQCYVPARPGVNAAPWGGKHSNSWLRFHYNGTAYFPWALVQPRRRRQPGHIPPC